MSITTLALIAFASNSLLCRSALSSSLLGPLQFTTVRLASGALMLVPLLIIDRLRASDTIQNSHVKNVATAPQWKALASALFLFSYALCFSLAYVQLKTGVGALILFASVQLTMMGGSHLLGVRATVKEWLGLALAFVGLVYLLLPGLSAPPIAGAVLMIAAGASWGLYSLLGKGNPRPVIATARNFLLCLPFCAVIALMLLLGWTPESFVSDSTGITLAVCSGALASGIGYVLWYVALGHISFTTASIAQLSVPILAGVGGIIFLHEQPSLRLLIAAIIIICGIAIAISGRAK